MVKVTLMSYTNKPLETIYNAFMNMHNKIQGDLNKINLSQEELESFMAMLMKQPHQTVLEFVNTTWLIEGASRAFQQQLTRTREASYSIQSLRIVDVGNFADNHHYTASSKLLQSTKLSNLYSEAMKQAQKNYRALIDAGAPVEDARGVLPLNIHSPITLAINLRSLYHLLELRFCENTQEEFREIAEAMKLEVATKIHPILAKPMVPICFSKGSCPSPVCCGKYPNFKQDIQMDVSRWIKG
jgi:thymidylate synthase (FAD)